MTSPILELLVSFADRSHGAADALDQLERAGFVIEHSGDNGPTPTESTGADGFLVFAGDDPDQARGLCRQLCTDPHHGGTPVFVVAESGPPAWAGETIEAGATDVLVPPLDDAATVAKLRGELLRHHARRELRRSAGRLRATLDALPDLLLEVTADGRITRARGQGRKWLDHPVPAAEEDPAVDVTACLPDELARALLEGATRARAEGLSYAAVADCPLATGSRWVDLRVVVMPPGTADAPVVALARDVTASKSADQQRMLLERNLRRDDEMKNLARLAGGVSNDMNNILGAIMGFASSLRADIDQSSQSSEDVDRIIEACWKGYDLASDLGNIAAERQLNKTRVSLNDSVREVCDLLERAIPPEIVLRTELHRCEPSTKGDAVQVTQTLVNLALNAIDAMQGGGILTLCTEEQEISVADEQSHPDLTPGRYAVLEVSDTGGGMDRNTMEHAFEPFFTTKARGRASGLGLPMVYGMVTSHGGNVSLDSRTGRGTTVRVYLPAFVGALVEPTPSQGEGTAAEGETALVVDDEELMLALGRRLLERLGYRVLTAQTGHQAIDIYQARGAEIALVLLDLIMPAMDGGETFERIRQIDPDAQIIVTSGYSRQKMVGDLLSKGAAGFLRKPYDLDKLATALNKTIPGDDD